MHLKDYLPSRGLENIVRCYRIVHFNFENNQIPPPKPYTPRPENCLAFYPHDTERVSYGVGAKTVENVPVALVGQHLGVTHRYIGQDFLVIQIIFQAGALYRLTGIPLGELTDLYVSADNVFAKDIHFVNEQLFYARDYKAMVQIVNDFVLNLVKKKLKEAQPIDHVCQLLLKNEAAVSLDWLARTSCLSVKQFERNFKDRTGVNPKTFNRLIRFDTAFRTRNAHPDWDWQRIAFDCNYYDYQHLVRDYKEFTGFLPTTFHALGSPEEVLGIAEQFYQIEEARFS